ncbi:MAG: B-box zinc finger protein [Acidobacteriia bacterium]|nr:B-box zinc finger protein [Terriglobia bacterium]
MNCAVHTEVDATGYCRNCGKPLCPACTRDVRGALYCETCLAGMISAPPAPASAGAGTHPGAALALGFIPGLGAVYNGEYVKALIHVLVFAGLIAAESSNIPDAYHAFLGLAIGCFYFYMPVEAYRTAKARQTSQIEPPPPGLMEGRRPVGAIILIGLGVFLLLANFGLFQWEWLGKVWPVGLIVLGVWILVERMKKQS